MDFVAWSCAIISDLSSSFHCNSLDQFEYIYFLCNLPLKTVETAVNNKSNALLSIVKNVDYLFKLVMFMFDIISTWLKAACMWLFSSSTFWISLMHLCLGKKTLIKYSQEITLLEEYLVCYNDALTLLLYILQIKY